MDAMDFDYQPTPEWFTVQQVSLPRLLCELTLTGVTGEAEK